MLRQCSSSSAAAAASGASIPPPWPTAPADGCRAPLLPPTRSAKQDANFLAIVNTFTGPAGLRPWNTAFAAAYSTLLELGQAGNLVTVPAPFTTDARAGGGPGRRREA